MMDNYSVSFEIYLLNCRLEKAVGKRRGGVFRLVSIRPTEGGWRLVVLWVVNRHHNCKRKFHQIFLKISLFFRYLPV